MNWSIAQLERNTADGGVTVAHWRVSAEETVGEETYSASLKMLKESLETVDESVERHID